MSPVTTPLLDRVRYPADLRNFSAEQLRQLADELRAIARGCDDTVRHSLVAVAKLVLAGARRERDRHAHEGEEPDAEDRAGNFC